MSRGVANLLLVAAVLASVAWTVTSWNDAVYAVTYFRSPTQLDHVASLVFAVVRVLVAYAVLRALREDVKA